MNRKMILAIIAAVVCLFIFGSGAGVGYMYCKRSSDRGVIKQQKSDATEVYKHEDKKIVATRIVERAKLAHSRAKDNSGCVDTDSGPEYVKRLQQSDSSAKSSFNP